MGHRRRVAKQCLHSAQAFAEGEVASRRREGDNFFQCAVELERNHAAEPGHLTPRNLVARMIG